MTTVLKVAFATNLQQYVEFHAVMGSEKLITWWLQQVGVVNKFIELEQVV